MTKTEILKEVERLSQHETNLAVFRTKIAELNTAFQMLTAVGG